MNHFSALERMVRNHVKRAIREAVNSESIGDNSDVLDRFNLRLRPVVEIRQHLGISLEGIWDELGKE